MMDLCQFNSGVKIGNDLTEGQVISDPGLDSQQGAPFAYFLIRPAPPTF